MRQLCQASAGNMSRDKAASPSLQCHPSVTQNKLWETVRIRWVSYWVSHRKSYHELMLHALSEYPASWLGGSRVGQKWCNKQDLKATQTGA